MGFGVGSMLVGTAMGLGIFAAQEARLDLPPWALWLLGVLSALMFVVGLVAIYRSRHEDAERFPKARIVLDRTSVRASFEPADDDLAENLMRLEATLKVTNLSSVLPLELVRGELPVQEGEGLVGPPLPPLHVIKAGLAGTYFQTGVIKPGDTEDVKVTFFWQMGRGSVTVSPFEIAARVVLTDQYGRKHKTEKIEWRC